MRISRLVVLFLVAAPAVARAEPRLSWLEGRWSGTEGAVEMEETWSSTAGGALLGMHKDVKAGKMIGFEFFRVAAGPDGVLTYFASPAGAAPTPFRLLELGEQKVVFQNPAHDFPQRVLYWRDAAGALHARIEGTLDGKPRAQEWRWTKAVLK